MPYADPKFWKVEANGGGGGFIKGVMIYKDNLMVVSMPMISMNPHMLKSINKRQNIK